MRFLSKFLIQVPERKFPQTRPWDPERESRSSARHRSEESMNERFSEWSFCMCLCCCCCLFFQTPMSVLEVMGGADIRACVGISAVLGAVSLAGVGAGCTRLRDSFPGALIRKWSRGSGQPARDCVQGCCPARAGTLPRPPPPLPLSRAAPGPPGQSCGPEARGAMLGAGGAAGLGRKRSSEVPGSAGWAEAVSSAITLLLTSLSLPCNFSMMVMKTNHDATSPPF